MMAVLFVAFVICVIVTFVGVLVYLSNGQPLQSSYREVLIRRADEQHAAILRGDVYLGVYGKYPPADPTYRDETR